LYKIKKSGGKAMKTLFTFLFAIAIASSTFLKSAPAEFNLRMLDNIPIVLVFENTRFDDNTSLYHIGNISHGNKFIEVFSVFRAHPNSAPQYRLIYRGTVYLRPNHITYAEINRHNIFRIVSREPLRNAYVQGGHGNQGGYGNHSGYGSHGNYGNHGNHGGYSNHSSMDYGSFMHLKTMMYDASFDSRRLELGKYAVSRNRLTSVQILELTRLFSFESNKLDFAKFAYQYVVDPGSYFIVSEAFSFNSSRRALFNFIGY